MSQLSLSIAELLIAKEDGRSTLRLFLSSPTPLEEKSLGRLFAMLEIDSKDAINNDIIDVIIEELSAAYYQSQSFEAEEAIEHALQQTNIKLQSLMNEIGDEWLNSFNCLIGVINDTDLIFTNIGRATAFMVYNGNLIDILESTRAKNQPINPVKVFNNTIAGELTLGSILLFGTESLLDYLSKEKIKRILIEKDPFESVEAFNHLLEEDTTYTNFGALLFECNESLDDHIVDTTTYKSIIAQDTNTNRDSMEFMVKREQATEELLSSSLWPNIRKRFEKGVEMTTQKIRRQPGQSIKNTQKSTNTSSVTHDSILDTMDTSTPTQSNGAPASHSGSATGSPKTATLLRFAGKMTGTGAKAVVGGMQKGVHSIMNIAKNRKNQQQNSASFGTRKRTASHKAGQNVSKIITNAIHWFQALSRIQKTFFVLAIAVLLIFSQMVINRGEEQISGQSSSEYAQSITDIELKINEGKAAVLYDSEKARQYFIEAQNMLNAIPTDSKAYEENGEEIQTTLDQQLLRVNNVITIENPTPIIDYTSINSDIQVGHTILLGASMYGFDQNNGSVYRGNLETQSASIVVSNEEFDNRTIEAFKASPGTGAVILGKGAVALFNPIEEGFNEVDLGYDSDNEFVDISIFGTRLYLLDRANNQIYRHQKTEDTFGTAVAWISDTVDFSNATSLAIDGAVYVLKENGELLQFTSGTRNTDFALADIDPALDSAEMIYTDENTENIYIVDKAEKRVVVYTKDGKLVAQYTSTLFTDIRDIVVDEANNTIYILNGSKLYDVKMQKPVPPEDSDETPSETESDDTAAKRIEQRVT